MTRRAQIRGFALITVLWIVALMALFVTGLAESTGENARAVQSSKQRAQADALAEAGFARAIWVLKSAQFNARTEARPLRPDGLIWTDNLAAGRVAIRIVPADSLIDLNFAAGPVLEALAKSQVSGSDAAALADKLTSAFTERQGQFATVSQAMDVLAPFVSELGLTRADLFEIMPLLTVASGKTAPDSTFVSAQMLRDIVGMSENGIKSLTERRRNNQFTTLPFAGIDAPDFASDVRPRVPVWHISVAARTAGLVPQQSGSLWVVYLSLPEERSAMPYFPLETLPLSRNDPIFDALQEQE